MFLISQQGTWGHYELSRHLSLTMLDREIVIDRTCARCRCEYEWGVHIAFFGERVAFSDEQITSLTHGDASDLCWADERDRLLVLAADALHDTATIGDELARRLQQHFSDEQVLGCRAGERHKSQGAPGRERPQSPRRAGVQATSAMWNVVTTGRSPSGKGNSSR